MFQSQAIDTTVGDLKKNLWLLAYPIMIGNLVQVCYNFADTFWVSKLAYSTEAVASVSIVFSVEHLLMSLIMGFSAASATLASQFYGAKRIGGLRETAYTTIHIFNLLTLIVTAFSYFFGRSILAFMKTPDAIMPYAIEYFNTILIAMIFMFAFYYLSALLRGVGDTKTPMIAGILSGAFNIVLDPLLIFGIGPFPAMGIRGAAMATLIARMLVAVYLFYMLFRKGNVMCLKPAGVFTFNAEIAKSIVRIGIPSSFSNIVISLGWILVVTRVNQFGAHASAVYGIGNRLDSTMFQLSAGIQFALATIVGQNIGAGKIDRAKASISYALKSSFILIAILSIFATLFSDQIFGIFSSEDVIINMGGIYVRSMAYGYAFVCCRMVLVGAFQGAGATTFSMILSMISLWVFRVPFAYAFSATTLGIHGVWLGLGISFVASYLFMYVFYKRVDWMKENTLFKRELKCS